MSEISLKDLGYPESAASTASTDTSENELKTFQKMREILKGISADNPDELEKGISDALNCIGNDKMFDIALMYEHGYDEWDNWNQGACESECGSECDGECGYVEQDLDEAFSIFLFLAEKNHIEAQTKVAEYYHYGKGVEKNLETAAQWYLRAAQNGDAYAQYMMAQCYEKGIGVEKDFARALEFYRMGAEQNDHQCQFKVGEFYDCGKGVDKDFHAAFEWYSRAGDRGLFNLALCYALGKGVKKNYDRSLELFVLSKRHKLSPTWTYIVDIVQNIESSNTCTYHAMNKLGMMYIENKDVPEDIDRAIELFTLAAKNGCKAAEKNLEICHDKIRRREAEYTYC